MEKSQFIALLEELSYDQSFKSLAEQGITAINAHQDVVYSSSEPHAAKEVAHIYEMRRDLRKAHSKHLAQFEKIAEALSQVSGKVVLYIARNERIFLPLWLSETEQKPVAMLLGLPSDEMPN